MLVFVINGITHSSLLLQFKNIYFRNYNVKITNLFQYFNIPTYGLQLYSSQINMYRYKTYIGTLNCTMRIMLYLNFVKFTVMQFYDFLL